MKYLIKFYTALIFLLFFSFNSFATEKIKIGLVIPLSGENKELGQTILKSVRLAINDINDNRIVIVPTDNQSDPNKTLEVSKELYKEGIIELTCIDLPSVTIKKMQTRLLSTIIDVDF